MAQNNMPVKINKLQQIVRLRQMLTKWRKVAGNNGSETSKVPPGHVAVYVVNQIDQGSHQEDRVRFVVKTTHLNHPLFRALLRKAEEEFGFSHQGALTIPCDVSFFKHLLDLIEHDLNNNNNNSYPNPNITPCASSSSISSSSNSNSSHESDLTLHSNAHQEFQQLLELYSSSNCSSSLGYNEATPNTNSSHPTTYHHSLILPSPVPQATA